MKFNFILDPKVSGILYSGKYARRDRITIGHVRGLHLVANAIKAGITSDVVRDLLSITADDEEAAFMLSHPGEVMPQTFINPRDAL